MTAAPLKFHFVFSCGVLRLFGKDVVGFLCNFWIYLYGNELLFVMFMSVFRRNIL